MGNQASEPQLQKKGGVVPLVHHKSSGRTGFVASGHNVLQKKKVSAIKLLNASELDDFLDELDDEDLGINDGMSPINARLKKHGLFEENFNYIKQENLVDDISLKFEYIRQLGAGASCRVLLVKKVTDNNNDNNNKKEHNNNDNEQLYALKELHMDDPYNPLLFKKEIRLLSQLNHPNILKYYASYLDHTNFYIATEYSSGGDLLERCQKFGYFSERKVSQIIYTVLDAIKYMHSKQIVHRDLKPGNIVFNKPYPEGKLIIIDFGDSEVVSDSHVYNEFVGTIHYLPPEITRYRHGWELKKGDMWAIGVLTYVLLCGHPPFQGKTNGSILKKIKLCKYFYSKEIIVSKSAKNFVANLIHLNVRKRSSAAGIMKHRWFKEASDTSFGDEIINNLSSYGAANKIQKLLLGAIISEFNDSDKQLLMKAFAELDENHDGFITIDEIEHYLLSLNMKPMEIKGKAQEILTSMDVRKTGKITFSDFIKNRAFVNYKSETKEEHMMTVPQFTKAISTDPALINKVDKIVDALDPNHSGYIDRTLISGLSPNVYT